MIFLVALTFAAEQLVTTPMIEPLFPARLAVNCHCQFPQKLLSPTLMPPMMIITRKSWLVLVHAVVFISYETKLGKKKEDWLVGTYYL